MNRMLPRQVPPGRCLTSCPVRHPHRPELWCPSCALEQEQWLEEQAALARLSRAHADDDRVLPATRSEWVAYLDSIAPLAPRAGS
jgi:hypothetical protein